MKTKQQILIALLNDTRIFDTSFSTKTARKNLLELADEYPQLMFEVTEMGAILTWTIRYEWSERAGFKEVIDVIGGNA